MKRHNVILIGVLILQVILSAIVFWPSQANTGQSEPLFPDLDSASIISITITGEDGASTVLQQSGGNWILPDADDYPADADKIETLLANLAALTTGRVVTRNESSHRQLQVAPDEFIRRIDFQTSQGDRFVLYLGSSPSYGATHFRLAGQNEAYLTNELSSWEVNATASGWIDTSYLSIPQADLVSVTLENANGTFTFTKDEEGLWTMEGLEAGETAANTRISSAVRQASTVNILRPLGLEEQDSYGMDNPSATVTLETVDATYTLQVGAQDPLDESYVVISSESPYFVAVAGYGVQSLVENTRADFIADGTE